MITTHRAPQWPARSAAIAFFENVCEHRLI